MPVSNEYYRKIFINAPSLENDNAVRIYFEGTEPTETPKHNRIMSVEKATTIAESMIFKLMEDIYKNSRFGWKPGTPLQGVTEAIQPLADGSTNS